MIHASFNSIESIAQYWKENNITLYFISPTNFNLLGMENWVGAWKNINFIDVYDGRFPHVLIPSRRQSPVFESMESINSYLLDHYDVVKILDQDRQNIAPTLPNRRALFLFFDEKIEQQCNAHNLDCWFPSHEIRTELDSKIVTTQLGNDIGVASVPNVIAPITCYTDLKTVAEAHNLGTHWVIQLAHGDSGKTTYFVANEDDYNACSDAIESQPRVKIMKFIRCIGTAIEACATRAGTFVGPLLAELIGHPELTPYPGGWCGNDLTPRFPESIRIQAREYTEKLGDAMYQRGYRGYFEVDFLLDLDTNALYLGELNPRISGVTALTNMSPFCQNTLPLFLFHLCEFSDIALALSPNAYNQRALSAGNDAQTAQFILKVTNETLSIITNTPETGVYRLSDSGDLIFVRYADSPLGTASDELFLFRILQNGDYACHGADLAIAFFNSALMADDRSLTIVAKQWIHATQQAIKTRDLTGEEALNIHRYHNPGVTFKGIGNNE